MAEVLCSGRLGSAAAEVLSRKRSEDVSKNKSLSSFSFVRWCMVAGAKHTPVALHAPSGPQISAKIRSGECGSAKKPWRVDDSKPPLVELLASPLSAEATFAASPSNVSRSCARRLGEQMLARDRQPSCHLLSMRNMEHRDCSLHATVPL